MRKPLPIGHLYMGTPSGVVPLGKTRDSSARASPKKVTIGPCGADGVAVRVGDKVGPGVADRVRVGDKVCVGDRVGVRVRVLVAEFTGVLTD